MSQIVPIKIIEDILLDLEDVIIEYNNIDDDMPQPKFSNDTLRAVTCVFMTVFMDKMWDLQESEELDIKDRMNMAKKAGEDIRKLIKTYTNIDSYDLC